MENLTPTEIVSQLDRYIIGQDEAKRAVAVAIRNRWRRQQLDPTLAKEVSPKNIIMIGPTGVGKTEIARRIATLTKAPFIKVEATKFTEVGYHGRDVESMVRDLLEQAISLVREELSEQVKDKAEKAVEQELLDLLLPPSSGSSSFHSTFEQGESESGGRVSVDDSIERRESARKKMLEQLQAGKLDDRMVEVTIQQKSVPLAMISGMGMDQMDPELGKMFESIIPDQSRKRKMSVAEAREELLAQATENLIDRDQLNEEAIRRTENDGIIFVDEIDKIATSAQGGKGSADVSRQGVQRDLLPIVEGSSVTTRHGIVNTDHILFIAAGAFHVSSVSDLMPELQGRFPIRVELLPLTEGDFIRILTEPDNAITKQQQALLSTEGLEIVFEESAISEMARLAADANTTMENIGARRLVTIMEKVFEPINFDAPERAKTGEKQIVINDEMVRERLSAVLEDEDLSKFVL